MKRTNRILLTVVLLVFAFTNIFAYDCEVNGIYYNRISVDEFEVTSGTNKYAGDIVIPETVEYREKQFKVVQIGSNAFKDCTSLTSVIIPQGITSLPDNIFSGCTCLTNVSIPQSVSTIGVRAFYNCQSLASVEIPAAVTVISDYLFYGCSKLASVTLPQGTASIGESAFQGCSSLEKVSMPQSVATIRKNAYLYCNQLKKVIVNSIAAWCKISFGSAESNPLHYAQHLYSDENTEIKRLTIDASTSSIGNYAFYKAENLTGIYLLANTPPTIGANTFGSTCHTWTDVYVPTGCKSTYQNNANWNQFKYIQEYDPSSLGYPTIKITATGSGTVEFGGKTFQEGTETFWMNNGSEASLSLKASSDYEIGELLVDGASQYSLIPEPKTEYTYTFNVEKNKSIEVKFVEILKEGATFVYDGIQYKKKSANEVEVTGKNGGFSGDIIIPASAEYNNRKYRVTSIGNWAFNLCSGLVSIAIPNSVKSIGDYAFYGCDGLKKVIVSDIAAWCAISFGEDYSNPLFYAHHLYSDKNTEITELVIPDGVAAIGNSAFYGCSSVVSVKIPSSVKSIGTYAFYGCNGLKKVIVPDLAAWCSIVFASDNSHPYPIYSNPLSYAYCLYSDDKTEIKDLVVPNGVKSIENNAFCYCSGLTSVTIPSSVTSIGDNGFYGCSGMTNVMISNSVKTIGKNAFSYCRNLKNITIPNSVTSIGVSAFSNCKGLTDIIIPNSVSSIPVLTFYADSSLTKITIPNSVKSIGDRAFENCISLASIVIPKSVETIGSKVWLGCGNMSSMKVESGNKNYDSRNDCNAIIETATNTLIAGCKTTTIPNGVTSIGEFAFCNCNGLRSITIPSSVTSIGNYAFQNINFNSVQSLNPTPPTMSDNAFYNTAILVLPTGSKEVYQNATGWSKFSNIMEINPETETYLVLYSSNCKITCNGQEVNNESENIAVKKGSVINLKIEFDANWELADFWVDGVIINNGEFTQVTETEYSYALNADKGHVMSIRFYPQIEIGKSFTNGGITYTRTGENEVEVGNNHNRQSGDIVIPESVTLRYKTYTVTGIGSWAFGYYTNLTGITIPNSVTSIGNSAFQECYIEKNKFINNSSLDAEANNYWGCSLLDSREDGFCICNGVLLKYVGSEIEIIIPDSVTAIGDNAFSSCFGLASVTIPNSITSIGQKAFIGCYNLSEIKVESGNSVYDSRDNCNAIINTETNTIISGCRKSTIPNGVTCIGNYAFYNCTGLTELAIPNSVTIIGNYAFYGCAGLTEIAIPNSVTSIGDYAFYGCKGLTEITIPNSVTNIGNYAFQGCTDLTEITIPNSVTSIGVGAFRQCESLRNITIPNGITRIMNNTFMRCTNLTNISLPSSITTIDTSVFRDCSSLVSITIPRNVTIIRGSAFRGCSSLTSVISLNPTPPVISYNTFTEYTATLQVPIGCKEAYQNANYWSNFVNIEEIETAVSGDANNDGVVDVADVMAIVNYILNKPGENFNETAADVNGDGVVNVADVLAVLNTIR